MRTISRLDLIGILQISERGRAPFWVSDRAHRNSRIRADNRRKPGMKLKRKME
jgi:hypothetical protein